MSKVGVPQAKMGKKYGVHCAVNGKVLKESKVDWIKTKIDPKYYAKRRGPKRQPEFLDISLCQNLFPTLKTKIQTAADVVHVTDRN